MQGETWRCVIIVLYQYVAFLSLQLVLPQQKTRMFGASYRVEQAHFADVVADLGLPVDAQLEDVRIATRYVCSLTLVQLEMLFARVAATWH